MTASFGKQILILAPHPDDEIVAACAAIGRARAEGAKVSVLFLTHGCIARKTLWPWQRENYQARLDLRKIEAEETALMLGVKIIGFQNRPTRHLWSELNHVKIEIEDTIKKHQIDQLWVPTYEGGHADHDGLNGLCQTFKHKMSVLEFSEYNYVNKTSNAQTFLAPNGTETTITLTDKEKQTKKMALALYASEQSNLDYVGTDKECFRPLADYDYSKPPHNGKLWYTRFQWVPFPHPRIDFTKPEDVSEKILGSKN